MVSPFEIYLVMQLDSLLASLAVITIALGAVSGTAAFFSYLEDSEKGKLLAKRVFQWFIAVLIVGSVIPSTKTAAAIIVIPAIANSETVQKEAGELYAIAKQALKEIAAPEEKKE